LEYNISKTVAHIHHLLVLVDKSNLTIKITCYIEPKGLSLSTHKPINGPYPETVQFSPHPHSLSY